MVNINDLLPLGGPSSSIDPINAPLAPAAVQRSSAVLAPPVAASLASSVGQLQPLLALPLAVPPRSWFNNPFRSALPLMPAQEIAGLNLKTLNMHTLMALMTSPNPFPSHPRPFDRSGATHQPASHPGGRRQALLPFALAPALQRS